MFTDIKYVVINQTLSFLFHAVHYVSPIKFCNSCELPSDWWRSASTTVQCDGRMYGTASLQGKHGRHHVRHTPLHHNPWYTKNGKYLQWIVQIKTLWTVIEVTTYVSSGEDTSLYANGSLIQAKLLLVWLTHDKQETNLHESRSNVQSRSQWLNRNLIDLIFLCPQTHNSWKIHPNPSMTLQVLRSTVIILVCFNWFLKGYIIITSHMLLSHVM